MEVRCNFKFGVFNLFVRDRYVEHALEPGQLAAALELGIRKLTGDEGWEVLPSNGLSPFTLSRENGGKVWALHMNSVKDVRAKLPREVVRALDRLDRMYWEWLPLRRQLVPCHRPPDGGSA